MVWRLWGFRQEKPLIHARFYWNREILARFSWHESVDSQSALPRSFLAAVFLGHQASCLSAVVEDESPAVAKRDLFGLPGGALVEAFRLCAGGVPFLVEPVEVRVVIRDPFLDGLPGWLDLLDGIDVEGRRWRARLWKDGERLQKLSQSVFAWYQFSREGNSEGLRQAYCHWPANAKGRRSRQRKG